MILLPEKMGKVSFADSLITYFSTFAQMGIPIYGIRACASIRDDKKKLSKTAQELFIISLVMTVVSYVILFITIKNVPKLYVEAKLYLILSSNIILTTIGMEWLYKSLENYSYITMRLVVFKIFALILSYIVVINENDYILYGVILVLSFSASYVINFINIKKYIYIKPEKKYEFIKHIKPILVFFAMTCATTIYTNLDVVMLGFLSNDVEVGYYSMATKLKSVIVAVITSFSAVILPRVSYYIENKKYNEFYDVNKKAISYIFHITIPIAFYFIIFAKESVIFMSGTSFGKSVILLQIIIPSVVFIGMTNILGIQILVPLKKENILLKSVIIGAIVDFIANIYMIPKYMSIGSSIAMLMAEISVFFVQYNYLKNKIKAVFLQIQYKKIFVAILFASLFSLYTKILINNCFLILIISSLTYFSMYVIILFLEKDEIILELYKLCIEQIKKFLIIKNHFIKYKEISKYISNLKK